MVLGPLNGTGAAVAPTAKEAVAAGATAKGAATGPASSSSVADASVADARATDQLVIRAGPPLPVLREMATNGLRELGALLQVVERQLLTSVVALTPAPLGYLARAMGDAAHQVGAGFAAMASAGSQSGADADGTGQMTQDGRAAAPLKLIVTAFEDGSKISTLPFTTKATGSAPGAVLAAPLADNWAAPGSSPATVSKPATSIAEASGSKSDSSMDRASVRPGAAEADVPGVMTRPSMTRLVAPRQAGAPASDKAVPDQSKPSSASEPGNDRNERGFAGAARATDPGPRGRVATGDVAGDMSNAVAAWRGVARQMLQQTSDALEQMSQRLQPTPLSPHPEPDGARASVAPDLFWAMTQVAGAQRQVAASMAVLAGEVPRRRAASAGSPRLGLRWGDRGQLDRLAIAVAIFGAGLLLILMALVAGMWIASVTTIGLCAGFGGAVLWGWRVSVGARGLRIALRR